MEKNNLPNKLYSFLPEECVSAGAVPGGWDPSRQVVPAFDPNQKDPERIKQAFKFGEDRVLVEIIGSAKQYFQPRLTGPENKAQGIYASTSYVSPDFMKVVN